MEQRTPSVLHTYEPAEEFRKRGEAKRCELCLAEFHMLKPQHQCKRCFRAVCHSCAKDKVDLYKINFQKDKHRLCKICREQSDVLRQLIQSQGLKWRTSSEVGRKWAQKVQDRPQDRLQDPSVNKSRFDFSRELLVQLWNSFNSSVRELVGVVTDGLSPDHLLPAIVEVMTAVNQKVEIKIQSTPYLVVVLLCFCSTEDAIQVSIFLLSGLKNLDFSQAMVLQKVKHLGCNQRELQKLGPFVETRIRKFISTFSINCVPLMASEVILQDAILECQPSLLVDFFSAVVFAQKDNLMSYTINRSQVDFSLGRAVKLGELRRCFSQLKLQEFSFDSTQKVASTSPLSKGYSEGVEVRQLRKQLKNSEARNVIMEGECKRLQEVVSRHQLQSQKSRVSTSTNPSNHKMESVEMERLYERMDTLEKENEELQRQIQLLKSPQTMSWKSSQQSPRVSANVQELIRQLDLLGGTLLEKNTRINSLAEEMTRTSIRCRTLEEDYSGQLYRIEVLEADKKQLERSNQELMTKLQSLWLNMLELEDTAMKVNENDFSSSSNQSNKPISNGNNQ